MLRTDMTSEELQKRNKTLELRWKIMLGLAVLFLITRPVALYIVDRIIHKATSQTNCPQVYKYINNMVVCNPPVINKGGYAAEQQKLNDYIKQQEDANNISDASLYFRDLLAGPVWGINELDTFAPASSLKLPLAIVYLNKADDDPSILQQKLSYAPNPPWSDIAPYFAPSQTIQPNTQYTIDDLVNRMLMYSDNNAYGVLQQHLIDTNQIKLMEDTFLQLGIIAPKDLYDQVINVRRYASIFTILYNSSILNPQHSGEALQALSKADFGLGLKDGVPDSVQVADKFGERILQDGTKQLSDCGIVYYPKNPYILCVMVRGSDYGILSKTISHISADIYSEVDSRKVTQ